MSEDNGRAPVIRIWAPDAAVNPEAHANMRRLAEIIPLVEGVLRKNGITVADIMPALKRGRYTPPEDYQYEIFAQPVTRYIGVEYGRIITAIGKDVDLCGTLCNSFGSDATRDAHIKNHGLSLILARNLPEQQISS